jgi:hypothetical protein
MSDYDETNGSDQDKLLKLGLTESERRAAKHLSEELRLELERRSEIVITEAGLKYLRTAISEVERGDMISTLPIRIFNLNCHAFYTDNGWTGELTIQVGNTVLSTELSPEQMATLVAFLTDAGQGISFVLSVVEDGIGAMKLKQENEQD